MNGLKKMVYVHNVVLLTHKEEWDYIVYRKMDGTGVMDGASSTD
jgi:hypothetical protein